MMLLQLKQQHLVITDTKLSFPVVTLSTQDNVKLFDQLNFVFLRKRRTGINTN